MQGERVQKCLLELRMSGVNVVSGGDQGVGGRVVGYPIFGEMYHSFGRRRHHLTPSTKGKAISISNDAYQFQLY